MPPFQRRDEVHSSLIPSAESVGVIISIEVDCPKILSVEAMVRAAIGSILAVRGINGGGGQDAYNGVVLLWIIGMVLCKVRGSSSCRITNR